MDTRKVRAHTILFTEDCPLNCRYCQLKYEDEYGLYDGQTFEEILEKIKKYDEEDTRDNVHTQLTFTGGEPFLYWEWIKQIIEMYQEKFIYHFNTSGYCFTEEILEFLSHYTVHFTLSVDGGESLTNYLRPVRGIPSHVGYFKKIKEIAPTLIYYFPNVICKIIINNRYVDLTYQTYLDMEQLGFRNATFILDFNSRPYLEGTSKQIQRVWNEEDTKILSEQIELIVQEIIYGFKINKRRMGLTNINDIIKFLMSNIKDYSPHNLICGVFNGRTLETLQNTKDRSCFDGKFETLDDAFNALIQEYKECNGKCVIDPECPAFLYCANYNCPISSFLTTGKFLGSDTLECILAKESYYSALKILSICNDICPDSKAYRAYLNEFNYTGKEEAINNGKLV